MHPGLRLGEQWLELKPAELISWKQCWQEPDYGVSLLPARPACALPSSADQRLMQSSCLFPSVPLHPPMHIRHTHTSNPDNVELLDPVIFFLTWKSMPNTHMSTLPWLKCTTTQLLQPEHRRWLSHWYTQTYLAMNSTLSSRCTWFCMWNLTTVLNWKKIRFRLHCPIETVCLQLVLWYRVSLYREQPWC